VHATREGWTSGGGFVHDLVQFQALLYNATSDYIRQKQPDGPRAADNATLAGLLLDSPAGAAAAACAADDASVSQYLTWSVNAYPQRMWLLWVLCACAAPLLRNAPTTVRLPLVLEVTQPAVSAVALLALCLVSWALDVSVFALLDTQSALGDL